MADTMQAAVFRGPGDVAVEEVPVPHVGEDDVLLRIRACGLCGSDLHSYHSGQFVQPGQVLGHEFVGEVAAVGGRVQGVREGDRAAGFSIGVCGTCYWCRRAQWNLCPRLFHASTGYGLPGGLADYVLIPAAQVGVNLHHVPEAVPDSAAALVEPFSVAVGAVAEAAVQPGDTVVVLGGGAIGNACAQVARTAGAGRVVLTDTSRLRLAAAAAVGADAVFDATEGGTLEWVQGQVGVGAYHFGEGAMADVVIEAAGSAATLSLAFELVRAGGTIAFVALANGPVPVPTNLIVHKLPRIVGCLSGDFPRALELLASGAVDTSPVVTHRLPLQDVADAFRIASDVHTALKVLVTTEAHGPAT